MLQLIAITALVMAMMVSPNLAAINGNLSAITWAHAVNSEALLQEALSSTVHMIEADIILGTLRNNTSGPPIPVMGHPPSTDSDITLETFLGNILNHNAAHQNQTKGVKLDFKSTQVFLKSVDLLERLWPTMKFPVWINADIIPGPVNNTQTEPVDPDRFFSGCQKLANSTLSIGWTTRWGSNFTDGSYTPEQITKMVTAIRNNGMDNGYHPITFPIRAGIAAQSLTNLQALIKTISASSHPTFTIWSSPNDTVNIDRLREFIFTIGLDKVYIDVPDDVFNRLDLNNVPGRASSLIHFGIVTMSMFLLSIYFSNYQM